MSPVRYTMFLVFTQLAVGCIWLLAWVPRRTIGVNFYRLMTVVAVIVLFFAMLARYSGAHVEHFLFGRPIAHAAPPAGEFWIMNGLLLLAMLFMVSVVYGAHEGVARLCGIAAGIAGAAALVSTAYGLRGALPGPAWFPVLAATFVLSALVNGGVAVGMNLGHWYLMARLPLHPLQRVSAVLLAAVGGQAALTTLLLLAGQSPDTRPALVTALKLESFDGIYVWIRLLVGLGFPLALAYMIRDTARSGSTMSATGLLYIALLTVFAGEAASRFLLVTTGMWL